MGATKEVNKKVEEDDYDPHEHRVVKIPTTNTETFIHFLKASVGTGVLAMPSAFSNAGYVNGLILTTVIGSIALYCLHLVINSMYELCKRKRIPYLTYPEAMTVAFEEGPPCLRFFAKIATPFVDGFLAFYHFGICCVYVVFIAESIKQIVDEYLIVLDIRIHMCFVLVPLFLIFSIRQLKHLVPFSSFANVLMFIGFGVVLYYIFSNLPPISERVAFEEISKLPLFFGTVLFSLEAVGVVIAIEQNMKTPKAYTGKFGIMNRGMFIVLALYMGLGFFGYWQYGNDSKGSVTLNIPQDEILAQVVKIFFAVTTLISYALQGYVTADIIWNHYLIKKTSEKSNLVLYELLVRACIVILTFLCAVAIPDLSLFLSLVGAFCLSILGLIFPALLELCCRYSTTYGKWKFHLVKDLLIVCFGIIGGIIGTYVSISEIVEAYK
ncbi:proton-coupled amino acid transporter-like protein CG1139 [Eupeodes corollae]|uniref:proton-coupled amino acid transporter-like protein CG1139 n=1 Tax=Eupeodes corollae TaxID=290404 RepID=UPI002491C048|nr:proton-coupled amino acid transporter-like protein CG1139 [Eupeodes corollae]